MPFHHTPYESPHFCNSLQYQPKPPPLVYQPWWSQLSIFLGLGLTLCLLSFHALGGASINLTGGRFTTVTGLYASILPFVNSTTSIWSAPSFANAECASKDTYVDSLSTLLSLQNYVALFYCGIILHSHIIFSGRCHVTNWYCNNSARHLCTTWVTLASGLNNFSVLQYTMYL